MRICLITPTVSPGFGGGITSHVANVVKGLVREGREVTVLSGTRNDWDDSPTMIEGAPVKFVKGVKGDTFNPLFWKASRYMFDELNHRNPFDIVLSEGSCAFGLLRNTPVNVPIVALLHQFKMIHLFNSFLEVVDMRNFCVYTLKTVPKIFYNALFQEVPFYRRCEGIICGAEHIVVKIKRYYKIRDNKIRVIPYWVDNKRFAPDKCLRAMGRRKLNIPENSFVFLIVSRIQKTKGIITALKAFAQAFNKEPDIYLVIAGGGNSRLLNSYRLAASELGISKNAIFTDMVSEEDLPMIYNIADAFIMPSLLTEVLPYTILEAMASGLPIIATSRPGNFEALGKSGVYFRIGNSTDLALAIKKIYEDDFFREECSKINYDRFINNFILEAQIEKWLIFFNEITGMH